MDISQLKTSLIKMGIPVFKDNKICKKDLKDLRYKESGLEISDIKALDSIVEPNKLICNWHLSIKGGDLDKIDYIFNKNKKAVQDRLLCYCHKLGFNAVKAIDIDIKNKNKENVWLKVTHHYDLKKAYEDENGSLEPFFYRLFERC